MNSDEILEIEKKIEASIQPTVQTAVQASIRPLCAEMKDLTKELTNTNRQVTVMLERLAASKISTDKIESNQTELFKIAHANQIDIAKLQTTQGGIVNMIYKVGLPVAIVAFGVMQHLFPAVN